MINMFMRVITHFCHSHTVSGCPVGVINKHVSQYTGSRTASAVALSQSASLGANCNTNE